MDWILAVWHDHLMDKVLRLQSTSGAVAFVLAFKMHEQLTI
jgi:hypothetical protein